MNSRISNLPPRKSKIFRSSLLNLKPSKDRLHLNLCAEAQNLDSLTKSQKPHNSSIFHSNPNMKRNKIYRYGKHKKRRRIRNGIETLRLASCAGCSWKSAGVWIGKGMKGKWNVRNDILLRIEGSGDRWLRQVRHHPLSIL